jgi:Fe-S cluster assembly protein SufD
LTYAFANNVLESVNIPELKYKIKKIIAKKLGVSLGFDL